MKKLILLLLIGIFSLVGCSKKTTIYYHDNSFIEDEIDKVEGCIGLAEAIRNNFFLNKKDSLFVENNGFLIHGLFNEYYNCIANLDTKQIIALFGIPHFEVNNTLYYITKYNSSFENSRDGRTFYLRKTDGYLRLGQGGYNHPDSSFNISSTLNNPNLKKADFLEEKGTYQSSSSEKIHPSCEKRKTTLNEEIFYHKKKKYYIVNSLGLQSIQDARYDISCADTFTMDEIIELFGKPRIIIDDKIYFHLYNKPFVSIEEKNVEKNGMVYCVCFEKKESGFYMLSTDMMNYSEIYRKN